MVTMKVLGLCLFFAMISSINGNGCYAPPFAYGPSCRSSTWIIGRPGHRVRYTINQVNNGGTEICCQVKACGSMWSNKCRSFKFYNIGCSTSSLSVRLPWGNNAATPAIRCKGIPSGTSISWSH